jgi:hypothetical protein
MRQKQALVESFCKIAEMMQPERKAFALIE